MKTNLTENVNPLIMADDGLPDGVYSSFEASDIHGKKALYNAVNGDASSLADNEGKEIKVADVVLCRVNFTDENGEYKENPRIVLITPDGDRFASSSFGILRSICAIYDVFGTLHFEEPITIIVKNVKTKKGHTFKLDMK